MWHLKMANQAREWTDAGSFDGVTAAARRVRDLEAYPIPGIVFEVYVDTAHGADDEAFESFQHTGKRALYVVKRQ